MNQKEREAGVAQLKALQDRGVKTYTTEEAKNSGIVLATYGRSWFPSDGEQFHVEPNTVVCFYKRGQKSNGVKFWGWSSKSGWDFYPVEPFAFMPDVKAERDLLFQSQINEQLTLRGDGIDRVRILAEVQDFSVKVLPLHGPTWSTNEDGSRTRIPDAEDKKDRAPMDYFQVIKK